MLNFALCLLLQLQSTILCIYAVLVVYAYLHMCPFAYMSHVHVYICLYRHIYIYELCLQCVSQQCVSVCTLCVHMCIYTHRYVYIYMYVCICVIYLCAHILHMHSYVPVGLPHKNKSLSFFLLGNHRVCQNSLVIDPG